MVVAPGLLNNWVKASADSEKDEAMISNTTFASVGEVHVASGTVSGTSFSSFPSPPYVRKNK